MIDSLTGGHMKDFHGKGWFKINDKLVLMISDDCDEIYEIYCECDYILCSKNVLKKHGHKFIRTGATIISLD